MTGENKMVNFKSIVMALVAIALVCGLASFAQADFWAGDGGGVIKKYNTDGTYAGISISTGLGDVRKLGYYGGYVYACGVGDNKVKRFSNATGAVDAGWQISALQPFGVSFDSAGKLYLCELNNSNNQGDGLTKVRRYDRDAATPDGWTTSGYVIYQPGDLAFDSAGRLYVTDGPRNIVERFNTDGTFESIFAQYNGLDNPTTLTFDSAGRLYTGNWGPSTIQRWLPDGTFDGTMGGYTNYINKLAFQGDKLMAKYTVYGTFGAVPGATSGGTIPGTWYGTADSIENWGFGRQGMAVVTVPEPSSIAALLLGLAGIAWRRKR
jgi:sugar lactone lactonase YvrE